MTIELLREIAKLANHGLGSVDEGSDLKAMGLEWPDWPEGAGDEGLWEYLNGRANAVLERIAELATEAADRAQYLEDPCS